MNNSDMASYIVATYIIAAAVFVALWAISYYKMRSSQKILDKIKKQKKK